MPERPVIRTYCPEYASVRTLVLVAVVLAAAVGAAPSLAAAVGSVTVAYVLYAVVAGVAVAALVHEGRRQRRRNPHEFVAREVVASFYEQQRPSPLEHLLHATVVAAGLAAVSLGAEPALSRQDGALLVVERLAAEEPLPAIDPANVAWGFVLVVGVVLLAEGLDRLLVGGYRELRYRLARS